MSMKVGRWRAAVAGVVLAAAHSLFPSDSHAQTAAPSAGEWPMAGRDYANTRFSDVAQITAANVKNLRLACGSSGPAPQSWGSRSRTWDPTVSNTSPSCRASAAGRDGSAALGFANVMKDLPRHAAKGGMLHVFALP